MGRPTQLARWATARIGSIVLFKWTGKPLRLSEFGWYLGEVELVAADSQTRESPGATHQVTHQNRKTNVKLPFRSCYRRRDAALRYPLGLSADIRGVGQQLVLMKSGE